MEYEIREANSKDVGAIMELVKELAVYEKAPEEVINTEEQMLKDGFGENPLFGAFLATNGTEVLGMALYYYRYSTWKGKRMYLEDLIVKEQFRGLGAGKKLFDEIIKKGKATNCTGMMWQVLDWNNSAIEFYKKYGTIMDDEWVNCHLDF